MTWVRRQWCRLLSLLSSIAFLVSAVILFLVAAVIVTFVAVKTAPESTRKILQKVGVALPLAGLAAKMIPPTLPPLSEAKAHWLPQNWHNRDRYWFHHVTQGTATFPMPYDWFVAIEQPGVPWTVFGAQGKFADEKYLRRFGFITSPKKYENGQDFGTDQGYTSDQNAIANNIIGGIPAQDYPDNPDGLPVGFARLKADPKIGMLKDRIGLTCAACHTGHLEYKSVSLRFDGGPAAINLQEYEKAIALALVYTKYLPFRFARFADGVLGPNRHPSQTRRLKEQLSTIVDTILTHRKWTADILENNAQIDTDEGFARLDALNRIGNQVFFEAMLPRMDPSKPNAAKVGLPPELTKNFASVDAPVSFPPIWSVSWFRWAQYDGSVHNELIRNAGEALGVKAMINLTDDGAITLVPQQKWQRFRSSVSMQNIMWIENLLAGPNPFGTSGDPGFKGLQAPLWKDAAKYFPDDRDWQVDEKSEIVQKGRELYKLHCIECHQGPVRDPEFDRRWSEHSIWGKDATGKPKHWSTAVEGGGDHYLNNVQKPVATMRTDPQQAHVLTQRQVYLPPELDLNPIQYLNKNDNCGLPEDEAMNRSFVLALLAVVGKTIDQWFDDRPHLAQSMKQMRGVRPNCPNPKVYRRIAQAGDTKAHIVAEPHYRARPLDGVWATAPYLHNGSVPTLYDMLSPQRDRPNKFCVGDRQFDPEKVGLASGPQTRCSRGLFLFDTSKLGNSNQGHSFEAEKTAAPSSYEPGIIGPKLEDDERKALIAYLKLL